VIKHRCQLVAAAHGVLQRSHQGASLLNVSSVSALAGAGLAHRDGAVREAAASMLAVVAGSGGIKAIRASMKDLAGAPLDLVVKEIEKLGASAGAEPAPPSPVAPPAAKPAKGKATSAASKSEPAKPEGGKPAVGKRDSTKGDEKPKEKPKHTKSEKAKNAPAAAASESALAAAPTYPVLGTQPLFGALDIDLNDPQCCQFCGLCDPSLADETAQDLHFWQLCPMLCQCPLCEQIIEVATLYTHLHGECETDFSQQRALEYRANIESGIQGALTQVDAAAAEGPASELYKRLVAQGCDVRAGWQPENVCPLCFVVVGSADRSWRMHLLAHPCMQNARIKPHMNK